MNLHDLSPPEGSNQDSVRRGRGRGARRGEACGRGNKGQKKRSKVPIYFEGGQTPVYRRFPKRGFTSRSEDRTDVVNVRSLNQFDDGSEITPRELLEAGLINDGERVKVLGDGDLTVSVTLAVHAASEGARKKIESAGGELTLLSSTPSH